MKMKIRNITVPVIVKIITAIALMVLIAFSVVAFVACLERGDIENAIAVGWSILMLSLIEIVLLITKF